MSARPASPAKWSWATAAQLSTVVTLLAALSCGGEPVSDSGASMNPLPIEGGPGPLDALSRRFGGLRSRMVERGYDRTLGLGRLFVLEGEGKVLPMDLATSHCTTVVALAGGSVRELRMSVYDAESGEVATDSVEGEGGLVHVCPQTDEPLPTLPHYLVLSAPSGSGAVVAGAFASAPTEGQGFEGLFEGVLAPRVRFRAVEEQLARSRSLLRGRGMAPLGELVLESVAEGDAVRMSIEMEPERCYVLLGRGDDGLRDIDLVLFDEAGAEVARDLEGDAEPSLEHCPSQAGRYTVEVRAYEGAGALGGMALVGPVPERTAEEGQARTETAAEPATRGASGASADATNPLAALLELAGTLAPRGYAQPSIVVRDGYIVPGEVRSRDVFLGAGCSIVIGAGERAETDLDLYLTDGEGRAIDRDTGVQPMARVRACLQEPSILHVSVKSYGRRGAYALATMRAPESIRDMQELRLEEATAALRARGYAETHQYQVMLEASERTERSATVRAGTCAGVAAAGDVDVVDLDVFLRSPEGDLLAAATGPEPYAAVTRCAQDAPEVVQVEIVMYRGSGTLHVTHMEGPPSP